MPITTDPAVDPAVRVMAARVVVLDLDGTLHEDPAVHQRYATLLQDGSGIAGLAEEVAAVLDRRHPSACPGDVVDVSRRLVIQLEGWRGVRARSWDDGAAVALPDDLPDPITTTPTLRYLGDRWQVAGAVAAVRGVPETASGQAFTTARGTDAAVGTVVDGAIDLLHLLRPGRGLLLATNTPKDLASPLVGVLGLLDLIDEARFGADKPVGTPVLVEHACRRWATTPDRVAVIGDNLLNDLMPAARMGCPTAHIDPWATDPDGTWSTVRVASMTELATRLAAIPTPLQEITP